MKIFNRKMGLCTVSVCLLISMNAYGGKCEVSYTAKKPDTKRFLFKSSESPKYKTGTAKGTGDTEKSCKTNALKSLKDDGWKIVEAKVKKFK